MDCNCGKAESSIHPFNHSQTQPNEHERMHNHQVWLIVVEEDLQMKPFNQSNQSMRMMEHNRNTSHQYQWIEEKGECSVQTNDNQRMTNHQSEWI